MFQPKRDLSFQPAFIPSSFFSTCGRLHEHLRIQRHRPSDFPHERPASLPSHCDCYREHNHRRHRAQRPIRQLLPETARPARMHLLPRPPPSADRIGQCPSGSTPIRRYPSHPQSCCRPPRTARALQKEYFSHFPQIFRIKSSSRAIEGGSSQAYMKIHLYM